MNHDKTRYACIRMAEKTLIGKLLLPNIYLRGASTLQHVSEFLFKANISLLVIYRCSSRSRTRSSPDTDSASTLTLDFPVSIAVRNTCWLFQPPCYSIFVITAWTETSSAVAPYSYSSHSSLMNLIILDSTPHLASQTPGRAQAGPTDPLSSSSMWRLSRKYKESFRNKDSSVTKIQASYITG